MGAYEDIVSVQRDGKEVEENKGVGVAKKWGQDREEVDEYDHLRVSVLKHRLQLS